MNAPKRILVTGGAGFIASHVADRLVASGRTCRKFGRQALTRQGNPAFGRPTPNAQQRP